MKIKVYGSQGSIPFSNKNNTKRGGNTSCIKLDFDDYYLVLDCGTGLIEFENDLEKNNITNFDIILSHLHLDHIIGLSCFKPLFDNKYNFKLFTQSRNNLPIKEQVFGIFKPPYWPIDLSKISNVEVIEINEKIFNLKKNIVVKTLDSNHPDMTQAFRINQKKDIVYLLDFEMYDNEKKYNEVVEFCKNANCIIFDSSYLTKDIENKKGWGHSTPEQGIKLAKEANCKKIIFSHFCHTYSDLDLENYKKLYDKEVECHTAFDGIEVNI